MSQSEERFRKVIEEIEKLEQEYEIPVEDNEAEIWTPDGTIRLWSVPRTSAELLKLLVLTKKPNKVLELGTSAGYSTLWMASALREHNGKIFTIDADPRKIELAKKFFVAAGLDEYIEQIQGKGTDILEKWQEQIDFVFLDADKQNYYSYIKQLEPHLATGALVIADNAKNFADLMADYLEYVSSSEKYYSKLLDIDNGLMLSVKLWNQHFTQTPRADSRAWVFVEVARRTNQPVQIQPFFLSV